MKVECDKSIIVQNEEDYSQSLYQWNEETSSYEILSSVEGLEALLDKKVDKEEGKGLSSNDFTTELKNKLETMSSTPGTIYVHN